MQHDATDASGLGVTARPALIYFRQRGEIIQQHESWGYMLVEGEEPSRFPVTPGEAKTLVYSQMEVRGTELPYTIADHRVWDLEETDPLDAVQEAIGAARDVSHLFSVHPKAMLLRMYRWALMRQYNAQAISSMHNHASKMTIDLCESFHYPAILPYDERRAFGTKDIERWLDFHPKEDDSDPETTLLQMLCMRCV